MANIKTQDPDLILQANPVRFYSIIFLADNGKFYYWSGNGISLIDDDEHAHFLDMHVFPKRNAVEQYFNALRHLKQSDIDGYLQFIPIPISG